MFLVNSSLALLTVTLQGFNTLTCALLFPKLRSKFAEFLQESYLEPLRLLASHTSVGLRYGHHWPTSDAFLDSIAVITLGCYTLRTRASGSASGLVLETSKPFALGSPTITVTNLGYLRHI